MRKNAEETNYVCISGISVYNNIELWNYKKDVMVDQNKYYRETIFKCAELEAIFKKYHHWGKEGKTILWRQNNERKNKEHGILRNF